MIEHCVDLGAREQAYREALNLCFPGWGGQDMFDWCFRRRAGGPAADFFIAEDDRALIAGSATTYRTAIRRGAEPEPIGCMTATWTLRAARGRGLFPQLIEQSREQARRRGCNVLIAFAATGKASRPGLLAAGALPVEGAFLTAPEDGALAVAELPEPGIAETLARFVEPRADAGLSQLVYKPDEWRGQMLDRPTPVERWRLDRGGIAIVERAGQLDRLLDLRDDGGDRFVAGVLEAAQVSRAQGRRISTFSLDPTVIAGLVAAGFAATRAWLYVMSTGAEPVEPEPWWFANGDRM